MSVRLDIRLAILLVVVVFALGYWMAYTSKGSEERAAHPMQQSEPSAPVLRPSSPPETERPHDGAGPRSAAEPEPQRKAPRPRSALDTSVTAYEADLWKQLDAGGMYPTQVAALLRKIAALETPQSQERLLALFASEQHVERPLQGVWADILEGIDDPRVLPVLMAFLESRLKSRDSHGGDSTGLWRVALARMQAEERSRTICDVLSDQALEPHSLFRAEILRGISGDISKEALNVVAGDLSNPNMASHAFAALSSSKNPSAHALALAHLTSAGHQAANVAELLGPRLTHEAAQELRDAAHRDPRVAPSYLGALSTAPSQVLEREAEHFRLQTLAIARGRESAVPYGRLRSAQALLAVAEQVATEPFVHDLTELIDVSVEGRSEILRALHRMRAVLGEPR